MWKARIQRCWWLAPGCCVPQYVPIIVADLSVNRKPNVGITRIKDTLPLLKSPLIFNPALRFRAGGCVRDPDNSENDQNIWPIDQKVTVVVIPQWELDYFNSIESNELIKPGAEITPPPSAFQSSRPSSWPVRSDGGGGGGGYLPMRFFILVEFGLVF